MSGKAIVAVDSLVGRLGLSVCNDLRFPELYQQLRFQHEAQLERMEDYETVFEEMQKNNICSDHSLLYELYASLLEVKENWQQAHVVYQIGILRKSKPLERMELAH